MSKRPSFARDLLEFVWQNKKWWIIPMLLVLAVFGVLIVLSASAPTPFIYTLF
ncbi:MAG TPA: DUF5989 family protein [Elusimicrobiota bacterium]|jgi:Family of unknown function (DUF5989)|nr:DUF5989 family protein [Elusimicrobiota bacterium]